MTRVFKDSITFFVYGTFLALEFILVFGMLLAALAVPYAIARYQFGAMPGSTESAWGLFIGVLLMGSWFAFLVRGGRKKIGAFFKKLTHFALRSLGQNVS